MDILRDTPTSAIPFTERFSPREVRQEGATIRGRRFRGTFLPGGGHSWFNPGWREGVSSHCGKVCPLPIAHKPAPQLL